MAAWVNSRDTTGLTVAQPSNRLGWWCYCTGHWFHTNLQTVRAHLFQIGCFFRETFSTFHNILAIDFSTKKCEYSFALHTRYDCFPKFVGQNTFSHFVWDPQPKSENLWRKLNSGQDLVAKDVVRAAVLGLFAGGECSLCFTRFCPDFSTFI